MTPDDYKKVFAEAARIAEAVPESMQSAAFNRALDLLIGASPPAGGDHLGEQKVDSSRNDPGKPASTATSVEDRVSLLLREMNSTHYPIIHDARDHETRCLALLAAARKDFGVDGLTSSEVVKILKDKFRVSISGRTARRVLGEAGTRVDRVPEGKGFLYRIMRDGEDLVTKAQTNEATSPPASAARSKKKPKKRGRERRARAATASGRGPSEWIQHLIDTDWFKSPRSVKDIVSELGRKGANYKASDFTRRLQGLVRDGVLERSKQVPAGGGRRSWHYEIGG